MLNAVSDPLSLFFNHAPDAILLIEPGSGGTPAVIVACNPCACRLYGYAAEELAGQPVAILDALNMAPVMDDAVAQARAEGALRVETAQNGKDGAYVEVDLSLTHIAHGNSERIIAIARDITTAKRTERRLMVQHAISGVLAEANHFMDAAPRMLQIIGEYLGWELGALWCVDYDAGVLRWTMGWHAPGTAVAGFEAESRARALQPGIGLPGEVWASGAPRWLGDLAAAASFSRVSDRGIGIPPDAQAHLFERFFRASNVDRLSIGVGIGLYVVKQSVSRHNGTVHVDSVEGLGSTFTVRLPLA